ncbi:hypothetical protein ATG_07720 [Desulfurococcaceae archaeon AG1]|nr:hypothetical protein ATG_07720 [Desulfurococcaceae archaeon AG1]
MPRASERLLIARSLVHISTSMSRIRFLLTIIDRRASLLRERGLNNMAKELEEQKRVLERTLAELEAVSERLKTIMSLGVAYSDLISIATTIKDLRSVMRNINPEISASLAEAVSHIEEAARTISTG